ncbi:cholesterol side-chain cleavage enzyme, mitochondrial-like [Prinia subflava]|uniref:cholesterol side-chain cleavage enzyme, mitochondrial-like n=1 Tax=Prinia subflava TaxID=208062 RepID=UPI002FDFE270
MLARVATEPGALRGWPRAAAAPRRGLCGAAAAAAPPAVPAAPRPFGQVPGERRPGWLNLLRLWREGGLSNLHLIMARQFRRFGPIYREKLGVYDSVNIISPGDAAALFRAEGALPERFSVPPWVAYRDLRNKPYGVLLKSGEAWRSERLLLNKEALAPELVPGFVPLLSAVGQDFVRRARAQARHSGAWTGDFSHELFRFALESVCHVLYGTRLGLLQDFVQPEAQRFIEAVSRMFHTTAPLLHLPPALLRRSHGRTWREHVQAWDVIFGQADRCIQSTCRELRRGGARGPRGILGNLVERQRLPLEHIRASVTEMMAGGVDTTSMTLQWALLELARAPRVQEQLRAEVLAAKREAGGDRERMLRGTRLLRAAIKETLRLHPVAVTLQRYTAHEVILQGYRIPPGTLVQVALFAMGRDPAVFAEPERFRPQRWLCAGPRPFLGLGFGFGPRQCLGRRIAELEMQLFLMHVLENFKVETERGAEIGTKFDLILVPDRPIQLTLRPLEGAE